MRFTLRDVLWLFVALACLMVNYPTWQSAYRAGEINGGSAAWQKAWGTIAQHKHEYYQEGRDDAQLQILGDLEYADDIPPTIMFPVRQQGQKHWWMMVVDREADAQTGRLSIGLMMPAKGGFYGSVPLHKPIEGNRFYEWEAMDDESVGKSILNSGEVIDWAKPGGRERDLEHRQQRSKLQLWDNQQKF